MDKLQIAETVAEIKASLRNASQKSGTEAVHAVQAEARQKFVSEPVLLKVIDLFAKQASEEPQKSIEYTSLAEMRAPRVKQMLAPHAQPEHWQTFIDLLPGEWLASLASAKLADATGQKRFKSDERYIVHYQYWLWQAGLFTQKPSLEQVRALLGIA